MASSGSSETPVAGNGRNMSGPRHAPAPESRQPGMLESARASVREFLSNLIGSRRAEVGHALYPDLDPITASENLGRNLRGKDGRKFGVDEVDATLDVLGREAEERWIRFLMLRRGIQPPDKFDRPDEVDELRTENERLRRENAEKDEALRQQALAFAGMSREGGE